MHPDILSCIVLGPGKPQRVCKLAVESGAESAQRRRAGGGEGEKEEKEAERMWEEQIHIKSEKQEKPASTCS